MSKVSHTSDLIKRTVYYHPNSINPSTNEKRNKYKLLVTIFSKLDIYGFIVSTTKQHKKNTPATLTIQPSDFEEINPNYASKLKESYYCWENCDTHHFSEIENVFDKVGKITISIFNMLNTKKIDRRQNLNTYSPRRHIVRELVASNYNQAEEIAKRFNI